MTTPTHTPITGLNPAAYRKCVDALEKTLRALEAHLDESTKEHKLGHRSELCPCDETEVPLARAALAEARRAEKCLTP